MTGATDEYLTSEDSLGEWLTERCNREEQGFESSADLFDDWRQWAAKSGIPAGKKTGLTQKLQQRGFRPHSNGFARGLKGILFKPEVQAERRRAAENAKPWWNDEQR